MKQFLAFDIGGTLIKYGILNEDGTIVEKREIATEAEQGGPAIMQKVKACGSELMNGYKVSGVCVSTAGQVDSKEGVILYASGLIPEYTGTHVKQELEAHFGLPVEVENDVNCAGYAESWVGTGKDAKSLFCLTIGTGIGGSYILDNKLHTGFSYSGGEIGYIPIEGSRFEELASTRKLISNVAHRKGTSLQEWNGKVIFELAKSGDEICAEEINRMVYYLSKGIATIAYMMNPEMIIVGGGITAQREYLHPLIMEQLKEDLIPAVLEKTKIEIARTLNDAGMIGALRHFMLQESLKPLKSITTIIESNLHKLTKTEQMIGKYIIQNVEYVPNHTISELSKHIQVSEATITRFCQKLEFESFNRLRLLAKEASVSTRLFEPSEMTTMVEVKEGYAALLKKFDSLHQKKELEQLRYEIDQARQVYLYGESELSLVAEQFKHKLMRLGIPCASFSSSYEMETSMYTMGPGTLLFCLSRTGYSPALTALLDQAKKSGSRIAVVTSQKDSPLALAANASVLIPSVEAEEAHTGMYAEMLASFLLDVVLSELRKERDACNAQRAER
jgi:predicted NBD/HSP70 family sugar kinase/DNA-binding MurR/RpiR family transcriptional regulator